MNSGSLSNKQLYHFIQNKNLNLQLRNIAAEEFKRKNITGTEMEELLHQHYLVMQKENEPLQTRYKILVIVFPFIIPVQSFFAVRWLGQGYKRKWKEYWFCMLAGYIYLDYFIRGIKQAYFIVCMNVPMCIRPDE